MSKKNFVGNHRCYVKGADVLFNFVGDFYLMTKGAEAAILSRCVKGDVEITEKHVIQYALVSYIYSDCSIKSSKSLSSFHNLMSIFKNQFPFLQLGLRTLCIAQRKLSIGEFEKIDTMLKEAQNSMENRDEKVKLIN